VNVVMNFQVPYIAVNFLTSLEPVSFTRSVLHGVGKYGVINPYTLRPPEIKTEQISHVY
jgi:hypothetical protein